MKKGKSSGDYLSDYLGSFSYQQLEERAGIEAVKDQALVAGKKNAAFQAIQSGDVRASAANHDGHDSAILTHGSHHTASVQALYPVDSGDSNSGGSNLLPQDQTGTNYNDELHGDNGDNVLQGLSGNDILWGGLGSDILDGGSSTIGGRDFDFASYDYQSAGIYANLALGFAGEVGGYDTLRNLEGLIGSKYDDNLFGDANSNTLIGLEGFDHLYGGAGNDLLIGGRNAVDDQAYPDNDYLEGGTGNDTLVGSCGDDVLIGGTGYDIVDGGAGRDLIYIDGGSYQGGSGSDRFYFNAPPTLGVKDIIADFEVGAGGDVLDVTGLFTYFSNFNQTGGPIANYLGVRDRGAQEVGYSLFFDADGTANAAQPVEIAILFLPKTGLTLDTLLNNHQIAT